MYTHISVKLHHTYSANMLLITYMLLIAYMFPIAHIFPIAHMFLIAGCTIKDELQGHGKGVTATGPSLSDRQDLLPSCLSHTSNTVTQCTSTPTHTHTQHTHTHTHQRAKDIFVLSAGRRGKGSSKAIKRSILLRAPTQTAVEEGSTFVPLDYCMHTPLFQRETTQKRARARERET
jgi:hypothetical protein